MEQDSQLQLSVCLCTHNPRRDYLDQVLAALAAQTLSPAQWELLIIDNASNPPLEQWLQLPRIVSCGRIIPEQSLGHVQARLRAIKDASAPLLVFVDDDNVLAPNYLAQAARKAAEHPRLGVFGGRCRGEFEIPPPRWAVPFLRYLAVGDAGERFIQGFETSYQPWHPRGAGLVVRRPAAQQWADQVSSSANRAVLGRRGSELGGADDIDLVLSVLEHGFGAAYDPALQLMHLIPAKRLTFAYLAQLIEQTHLSGDRYFYERGLRKEPRPWPLEHLVAMALYMRQGGWRPNSLRLAVRIARGRYAAWRRFKDEANRNEFTFRAS